MNVQCTISDKEMIYKGERGGGREGASEGNRGGEVMINM